MASGKRLIDADALIKEAHWVIRSDGTRVFVVHAEDVDSAEAVDAVEVVHCRDCKHWKDVLPDCTEHKKFCEIMFGRTEENCFCSFGERREGE